MNENELPYVSICMPTYNRNNFKGLILNNLRQLNYPKDKLEFVVDDDGTEKFLKDKEEEDTLKRLIHPIKLQYFYRPFKRSIGVKRNNLTKIASYKIIACMDSDDIYMPEWLMYGITEMKKNNYTCVGSNQMLFLYPYYNWTCHAIRCEAKRQIHEACMIYTKKHHKSMGGFRSTSQGEGSKMADFNEKNVGLLEIDKCMCCICHKYNTIPKDMFRKKDNTIEIGFSGGLKDLIIEMLDLNNDEQYLNNLNKPIEYFNDSPS
jgi:glycosyltransferase involved in cell wall biosynthesis